MAKRRRKKSGGCARKKITFKAGRKTVSFMGRQGSGCGPRKKPSTAHLRHYKSAFKSAVKACKGSARVKGGGWSRGKFNNCIATHMPK